MTVLSFEAACCRINSDPDSVRHGESFVAFLNSDQYTIPNGLIGFTEVSFTNNGVVELPSPPLFLDGRP